MNQRKNDVDDDSQNLAPLASGLAGSVSGTLIGLAIGGPIGATIGAAGGPLVTFAMEAIARRKRRAAETLENAAKLSNKDVEDFVVCLLANENITDLAAQILSYSANSPFEEKLHAYASLLSDVERTDAKHLDSMFILARILDALEPIHFRVLAFVKSYNDKRPDMKGCAPSALISAFSEYEYLLRSVVRTLELHGLLVDESRFQINNSGQVYWSTSDLGNALIKILSLGITSLEN